MKRLERKRGTVSPDEKPAAPRSDGNRILVKLRPSSALGAAETRANLRPLHEGETETGFGLTDEAQWFMADLPEGADSPWDLAHARVADQLGVSDSDVVFAEPDLIHTIYLDPTDASTAQGMAAVGTQCSATPQDNSNGKATGPSEAWHLNDDFSQLRKARDAVAFTDRRTRIAHLDTGYFPSHITLPRHINKQLQHNFVEKDGDPDSAVDPNNKLLILDNSGHGTGTLSILAGKEVDFLGGQPMGGAPDAEVVPLRIADSVVLLRTSAFARALRYAVDNQCDVLSMSMGGVPSEAWRDEVDRAYLAGLCMVTAAGNNKGGLPTRHVVYPARYARVIAAAGVMANRKPYAKLERREMEGNFGPDKIMKHALAAFTPNVPWAVFGCADIVRRNGAGTSSATPQVAAAAALWLEKYKQVLPRDWRRVEAVRHALFSSALKADATHFGNGILQAHAALSVAPDLTRPQSKSDSDSFAFLRVITGLGIAEPPARERMYNLELAQRWLLNQELQKLVPDPDDTASLDDKKLAEFMEAVIADANASMALRKHVAARYSVVAGRSVPVDKAPGEIVPAVLKACDPARPAQPPAFRRLRVYALDPSFSTRLETSGVNEVVVNVRWEKLDDGPSGEYLKVEDVDAAGERYVPVNLNEPALLAQDGWAPSEGNAQFHQQMVYAVAMKTIDHFERALGRPVLWRHTADPNNPTDDSRFTRQLKVFPHALRQRNAYYSPPDIALRFGYFETPEELSGEQMPGSRVYACLSHDIIAHETTHAILDGMHRRFNEPTNVDVLAFHEAFADIVALMQHFTIPQVLELQISRTRGDIETESLLGSLAVQFGRATSGRGALREAIGRMENGTWVRFKPDPLELQHRMTPHARGAILVAAVFDAFIAIYKSRTRDLIRISTGGTGELPAGDIHPDLVRRLSDEAATSAGHVLNMCIRALDYLPPVDVTFFEYLRALITADFDLVRDDRYNYRVAFVEAFRRRGIYPLNLGTGEEKAVRTLSVDTLRWQGMDYSILKPDELKKLSKPYTDIIGQLKRYAQKCMYLKTRKQLFNRTRAERISLQKRIKKVFEVAPDFAEDLGLKRGQTFEVHSLRSALRSAPDGKQVPQVVVELTQTEHVAASDGVPAHMIRGGSTLIVDLGTSQVKYRIFKNIASETRRARTAEFARQNAADPLRALLFRERDEPFAALHFLGEEGI